MSEKIDVTLAKPPAVFANNVTLFVMGDFARVVFTELLTSEEPAIFRTGVVIPIETLIQMHETLTTVVDRLQQQEDEAPEVISRLN